MQDINEFLGKSIDVGKCRIKSHSLMISPPPKKNTLSKLKVKSLFFNLINVIYWKSTANVFI